MMFEVSCKLVHGEKEKKRGEERRGIKHIPSRKTTNYKIELQGNHGTRHYT